MRTWNGYSAAKGSGGVTICQALIVAKSKQCRCCNDITQCLVCSVQPISLFCLGKYRPGTLALWSGSQRCGYRPNSILGPGGQYNPVPIARAVSRIRAELRLLAIHQLKRLTAFGCVVNLSMEESRVPG